MKEIYPEFAEQVNFYAVGTFIKAVEDVDRLENHRRQERFSPGP